MAVAFTICSPIVFQRLVASIHACIRQGLRQSFVYMYCGLLNPNWTHLFDEFSSQTLLFVVYSNVSRQMQ